MIAAGPDQVKRLSRCATADDAPLRTDWRRGWRIAYTGMMIVQNTQERVSEQTEIEFRQLALKSLVSLRNKQLQESLDHRIKRAVKVGAWIGLTLSACRSLHNQEKARLREQLAEFQFKQAYMKEKLTEARKAVARARRLRASQQTATRKGRSSLS
jgi:hypothetical protein